MTPTIKTFFQKNESFTVQEVAQILSISNKEASVLLSRYAHQGNIKRIKPGVYIPVSERFLTPDESFSNPWLIIPILYPTGYIGGWSAASHWGFTDQLFETTCIMTPEKIRHSNREFGRFKYHLFKIKELQNFGTKIVWHEKTRILISDSHKTIIDLISNPKCGAGIQHTIDCLKTYFSESRDEKILLSYAERMQNGAFFKRLGFLSEKLLSPQHPLCLLSQNKMTKGYISIDSEIRCTRLITKWNLFIPEDFEI